MEISGLAECAKAVRKTNLGRRLLMLTCMKPRLFWLQKSTNESVWGHAGPGLASTSPEEQRTTRMRVWLKTSKTGRLVHWEQSIKGADFWCGRIDSGHNVQGCGYSGGKPRHWVMIREVASLDTLVILGVVTACVGVGTPLYSGTRGSALK